MHRYIFLLIVGCGGGSSITTAAAPEGGRLLNPVLDDGTPVMMGYDSHHPDCFTFPTDEKDSEKVACPDKALAVLHDCRGSKLYLTGSSCVCVPVSGEETSEVACPDGTDTSP